MSLQKLMAIVLIVVGVLGVAYGGFTYTRGTHEAELGPLSVAIADNEHVTIPLWAGIASLIVGAVLLLQRNRL